MENNIGNMNNIIYIIIVISIMVIFIVINVKYKDKIRNNIRPKLLIEDSRIKLQNYGYDYDKNKQDDIYIEVIARENCDVSQFFRSIEEPVKIIDIDFLKDKWTISFWVIPMITLNKACILINTVNDLSQKADKISILYYNSETNTIRFVMENKSGKFETKSTNYKIKVNEPIHYVWSQNNDRLKLYVNGKLYISSDDHQDFKQKMGKKLIIKTDMGNIKYKHFHIYNKVKSTKDIQDIYNRESKNMMINNNKDNNIIEDHIENGILYTKKSEIIRNNE